MVFIFYHMNIVELSITVHKKQLLFLFFLEKTDMFILCDNIFATGTGTQDYVKQQLLKSDILK